MFSFQGSFNPTKLSKTFVNQWSTGSLASRFSQEKSPDQITALGISSKASRVSKQVAKGCIGGSAHDESIARARCSARSRGGFFANHRVGFLQRHGKLDVKVDVWKQMSHFKGIGMSVSPCKGSFVVGSSNLFEAHGNTVNFWFIADAMLKKCAS